MLDQLGRHLVRQVVTRIEHGAQQTFDFEIRVDGAANLFDGLHQRGQSLKRVVLALHRHHDGVRGHQGVQGEHVERGGAIDQNHVEVVADGLQGVAQLELTPGHHGQQPHLGGGQLLIGRHQHEPAVFHRHHGLHRRAIPEQHIATGANLSILVDSASHGGIALRIQIDQQEAPFGSRQRGRQIHGGGCLTDASFLICDRNDPIHEWPRCWMRSTGRTA